MQFLTDSIYVERSTSTAPQLSLPEFQIPPSQREFVGLCWAYWEVDRQRGVRLTARNDPAVDAKVTFGYDKDPHPSGESIDLSFSPSNPLTCCWVGAEMGAGVAPQSIEVEIIPL